MTLRVQVIHYIVFCNATYAFNYDFNTLQITVCITFRLHVMYSLVYHILSYVEHDFNYVIRDIAYDFKPLHTTLSISF